MMKRLLAIALAGVAFVVVAGLSPKMSHPGAGARSTAIGFAFPAPAYAAGSCSLAPLVCANDSSPGCETICGGDQQATCVEGTCSPAGNIVTSNHCSCK
jgi:hypothetical protein